MKAGSAWALRGGLAVAIALTGASVLSAAIGWLPPRGAVLLVLLTLAFAAGYRRALLLDAPPTPPE